MAAQKPLVIIAGQIQQLPSGDTLAAAASEVDVVAMTNANVAPITLGMAVYVSVAGSVDKANASASGTARVLGLVKDASIAAAGSGYIQTDGIISSADWTAVTGATTLTAGSLYFLDSTAGKLTATAPTTSGKYVVQVGLAISTTEMELTIDHGGILLS